MGLFGSTSRLALSSWLESHTEDARPRGHFLRYLSASLIPPHARAAPRFRASGERAHFRLFVLYYISCMLEAFVV